MGVGIRLDASDGTSGFGTGGFGIVFERAPSALLMVDLDASLVLFNARCEGILGYSRKELVGRPVERLAPRGGQEEMRRVLLSPMGPLPPRPASTVVARHRGGRSITLEIEPRLIEIADVPFILASIVDVTERLANAAAMEAAVREKALLIAEVHHRVKNNLQVIYSLLDLQRAEVGDPELAGALSDSCSRIVSMALVHQAACQAPDVARIDFRRFLEMLLDRVRELHGSSARRVPLELEAVDLSMPMDRAMPCGLAVNELLGMALRQSAQRQAALKVSLSAPDGTRGCLRLRFVAPARPLVRRCEGRLGERLIELLAAQAHARLRFDAPPGDAWSFTFPLHAYPED